MPYKFKRPCKNTGCVGLTSESYCVKHKDLDKRASASKRGYDSRWQGARKRFLKANPLCVKCLSTDVVTVATVVDHITPHRGDKTKFWDDSNWQSLCKKCHDRKTMTEDRCCEYKL